LAFDQLGRDVSRNAAPDVSQDRQLKQSLKRRGEPTDASYSIGRYGVQVK